MASGTAQCCVGTTVEPSFDKRDTVGRMRDEDGRQMDEFEPPSFAVRRESVGWDEVSTYDLFFRLGDLSSFSPRQ